LQEYNKSATTDLKQLGFSVAGRGMESLVEELAHRLDASSQQLADAEERIASLNTMKMTVYAFCQLIDLIEADQLQVTFLCLFTNTIFKTSKYFSLFTNTIVKTSKYDFRLIR
jgi:hypothetical protein